MNWGELKQAIRDLGFEEDSTMEEYESIVLTASNRAINMLIEDVLVPNKMYFKATLSTEETPWELPSIDQITEDTADDTEIDLPERVIPVLSRLASHYVWLDDDQIKATIYWNEYDTFKSDFEAEAQGRNYNCVFHGGLWF